jgi:hypothetical protein
MTDTLNKAISDMRGLASFGCVWDVNDFETFSKKRAKAISAILNAAASGALVRSDISAAREAKLVEALRNLVKKIAAVTLDDGPRNLPRDGLGAWVAGLDACEKVAQREVDAILSELGVDK